MKMNLQPKLSGGLIIGLLLAALELGLFVTKADLYQMKTEMYQNFEPRSEVEAHLNKIDAKIDRLTELMINEKK